MVHSPSRMALAAVFVTGLAACGTDGEPASRALVFQHAIVIDGTGGPVIKDATIVVEDGWIAALG
ncbi:MAG: amidohydrolase family protein, partial [Gemmatimonadetes bacterium]|nr:amidohydrolase family protein [Gemmatimonadota bacterium]